MNLRLPAISAILVLIVMVVPVSAHHSVQAQFDLNKPITLTGKVTKVEWINPHSYLLMEVSDDKGNVKKWAFEMAGPGALRKSGLSRADRGGLKAGDVVTINRRMDPNKPIYKPEFWEKVQQLDQNGNNADPSFGCMPAGVPRMGPPAKIVQTPTELLFFYISAGAQGWGDQYRIIPIDGRQHTPLDQLDGTWKGESIGHWEGDTMVIDTIGFNDISWLDIGGYLHSENLHVIERLRREGDTLTWQVTVEDPDVLIKPWVTNPRVLRLNPDPKAVLEESLPCSERDLEHLVTKEHH